MERIDELLKRIKKQQEAAMWEKIRADAQAWRERHELVLIEVTVKNRITPSIEFYAVHSEDELRDLLRWIAERGPFQPFSIREAVPGVYEVGPYDVLVRRYWKEKERDGHGDSA